MLIEKLESRYGSTMTPKDAANELHSHPTHIREMCRKGQLPAVQIGNRWRIPTAKLAAIIEGFHE